MSINNKTYRDFPAKATTFSQFEPEYFLNKDGHLEEYPALRDTQAVIDSSYETVFQSILSKLSEAPEHVANVSHAFVMERDNYATSLDLLLEADEVVANYKAEHPEFTGDRSELIGQLKNSIKKGYDEFEKAHKAYKARESQELQENSETSTQA